MAAIDRRSPGLPSPGKSGMVGRIVLGCVAALMMSAPPAWSQSEGPGERTAPIETLHRALHLSQGQDGAWQAYRAAATAPPRAQDRRRAAAQMFASLNAPQRMDLVEAEMKQELFDLQQQSVSLKTFYVTLSPEQRAIFDAQTLPAQGSQQQPGQ